MFDEFEDRCLGLFRAPQQFDDPAKGGLRHADDVVRAGVGANLVRLAETQPETYHSLKEVKGLSANLLKYNANEVLSAIQTGKTAPPPQYHPNNNHRPDDDTLTRYETLRQWRNNLASERGVEPDVIMSNDTLMDIARRNPRNFKALLKLKSLGEWQAETYGRAVLQVLQEMA